MTPALEIGQRIEFRTRRDEWIDAKIVRAGIVETISESRHCVRISGDWHLTTDLYDVQPVENQR